MLTDLLVKESIGDQFKQEFQDIWDMIKDFFIMIKELTYDNLAEAMGSEIALLLVLTVGIIGLMLILSAVINR